MADPFTGGEPFLGLVDFLEENNAVQEHIDIDVFRQFIKYLLNGLLLHRSLPRLNSVVYSR
jgi:hypothetical protein